MPVETELYELLSISVTADEEEVKKAYRKKAKEHHPDKNINDPEAGERFQGIQQAYEILSDPDAREAYDRYGLEGLARGAGHSGMDGMDASDIFSELFGGGFSFAFGGPGMGGPGPRPRKGQDSIIPYDVTLEDLYNGKHVKMNMAKEVVCSSCEGTGAKGKAKPKQCVKCEGNGFTFTSTPIGPSLYGQSRVRCEDCAGKGEKLREKDRCKKCKGKGTVEEKKRQEIFVEKGMTDRQRIVLAGEGDQSPNIPAGDVIFDLKLQRHDSFERSGNDLLTRVSITLSESLLGFSRILLTHLDGRGIRVDSPPGKAIRPGDTIIVRGEGMPQYKNPDIKGDLFVVFDVEFPEGDWLKDADRAALERILPPKKPELDPLPGVVDDARYNAENDFVDVRNRSFPAGSDFMNGSSSRFGGDDDEDEWVDEDDDEDEQPECRTQ